MHTKGASCYVNVPLKAGETN